MTKIIRLFILLFVMNCVISLFDVLSKSHKQSLFDCNTYTLSDYIFKKLFKEKKMFSSAI